MDSTGPEMLCQLRERLSDRIGVQKFQTWFSASTEFELAGHALTIYVPTAFVGNWIVSNYTAKILDVLRELTKAEPQLAVRVRPKTLGESANGNGHAAYAAPPAEPAASAAVLPAGVGQGGSGRTSASEPADVGAEPRSSLGLRGELSTFVVGPSNQLAFSAAQTLARAPGAGFRHLLIHGGCGLGKTHLLQGICNGVRRSHAQLRWEYRSGEEFTNEFIFAVRHNRVEAFRLQYRKVDILAIDDIHFLADKKATQEEFLHTFNAIDACGKAVVLSSDRHPRELGALSGPLQNRLMAAMVVEIDPPDLLTRREILARRGADLKVELSDDVLDYLARNITSNVRVLEGALYRLVAFAALTKEPMSLDVARRAFHNFVDAHPPLDATTILRVVAAHFGVSPDAVRSTSRDRNVTLARSLTFYLMRKHTKLSYPEIGRALSYKNHSTVVMAVQRIQEILSNRGAVAWKTPAGFQDVPLQPLLDELEQQLPPGRVQPV